METDLPVSDIVGALHDIKSILWWIALWCFLNLFT